MTHIATPIRAAEFDVQVQDWAASRFDRTLLFHGDLTSALRDHSHYWVARSDLGEVAGVGVRFDGFALPSISIAADDVRAFRALLAAACTSGPSILAVSAQQQVPEDLIFEDPGIDPWLVASCASDSSVPDYAEELRDTGELADFYKRHGLGFWCEATLRQGHAFGIRSAEGSLVCAASVTFVLPDHGYAHIGSVLTSPPYRGRGYAGSVLAAVRRSLSKTGIRTCGLFADASDPSLPLYYTRLGFHRNGGYRFLTPLPKR